MGQPDHTLSLPHTEHHQETQPPSPATSHHQGSSDPFPQGTCSHTKVQKVLLGMLPCQTRGSPLTQVGHQVDQAHEQQAPDAEHHEQEEEQDGGHRFHSVVAQMPLWEAHVHQLPVEVVEGGQRSSQPGTCLLLLLAGTRASWSGPVAPMEKALEGEERDEWILRKLPVDEACESHALPLPQPPSQQPPDAALENPNNQVAQSQSTESTGAASFTYTAGEGTQR